MLNEPALVLLGTLVASVFLVLGVLDLVWPAKPSRPRRGAPPARIRPDEAPALLDAPARVDEDVARPAFVEEPVPIETTRPAVVQTSLALDEPRPAAAAGDEAPPGRPSAARDAATYAAVLQEHTASEAVVEAPSPVERDAAATLEHCRRLAADGRPGEAVAAAVALLEEPDGAPPGIVAALWQEVALARDRMGDRDGALGAYRSAMEAAPAGERETVRRELAAWAARTARDLVASADDTERYAALVLAREFLAAVHETVGAAGALDAVRADLDVEFWPAYETHVRGLVGDRDHAEAYRLATEALADDSLPESQRSTFEEIRTETLAARIDALVSRSIVAVDERREWEAVGGLERAEALLKTGSGLSPERRDEAMRRVAEGYGRLGRRRVDNGECEEAIDPLLRALRLDKADGETRDAARWAMVQALQAVVDARSTVIREIAATGGRDSAVAQADKLWTLLRSGIAAGVPQESMTNAMATTRRLLEDLGAGDR